MRVLAIALLLLLPVAAAQTVANPVRGDYEDVYIIAGRGVDALGGPTVGATVYVHLEQKGVKSETVKATADCFGVFITYFDLKEVRRDGKAHVRLEGRAGGPNKTATMDLDHFFRRSDVNLRYEGRWDTTCPDQTPLFGTRVSVTGRILNRTEPYEVNGTTYHAKPHVGDVRFRYWPNNETSICPPHPQLQDRCDGAAGPRDERGDFRYSWTFSQLFDIPEGAKVQVLVGDESHNFTVDPVWRVATVHLEATGQGPAPLPTPGAPLVAVLALVAALALARRKGR